MTRKSYVYFIRQEGTGLVKIGRAANPTRRMGNVQVGSPQWLRMIGYAPEVLGLSERAVHGSFEEYWVRGEWHREEGALAEFIRSVLPWFIATAESKEFKRGYPSVKEEWRRMAQAHLSFIDRLDAAMPRIEKMPGLRKMTLSQKITIGMKRIAREDERLREEEAALAEL